MLPGVAMAIRHRLILVMSNQPGDQPGLKWHNLSVDEALGELATSPTGLSGADARQRLQRYGTNELTQKSKPPQILVFIRQFASPLIYILLVAALVEFLIMHKPTDGSVILAVLVINSVVGYIQESRAEQAMEALKKLAAPNARVKRQGVISKVAARELVPGDIILLEAGDKIPVDGRLLEAVELGVDESILTGESVPVLKFVEAIEGEAAVADMGNMVHMGCAVVSGRGVAVVTATGMNTEIGKITLKVQQTKPPPTPLQRNVARLGRYLGFLVLGTVGVLMVIGLIRGYGFEDMFTLAVAAAVSAIPEGLPVLVTVVLALGMRRMAKRHALVRKLTAVETMGSVTAICSDKTGTLTRSEMTLRRLYLSGRMIDVSGSGYLPEGEFSENGLKLDPAAEEDLLLALKIGSLCNDSSLEIKDAKHQILGDPTEGALLVAALKAGLSREGLEKEQPRQSELPFSSEKRYMATMHSCGGGRAVAYVKGSVDRVLAMSRRILIDGEVHELTPEMLKSLENHNESMAAVALRVMALAYTPCSSAPAKLTHEFLDGSMVIVALAGIMDPPRPEAARAIADCTKAGIKVMMITGDQKTTAVAIATELGLPPGDALTGVELEKLSDIQLSARIDTISVFARVEPLHKLRIVNAMKGKGYTVAVTGDGVNDGPALRAADIGIAMGIKGTEVAREASDMVLTDDNFASIVAAVEEGRVVFNNIRRSVFYLLSTNAGELFTWIIAIAIGLPLPVVAVQILWINLVSDGACVIPLGLEPRHSNVLEEPPRRKNSGVVYHGMLWRIIYLAVFMALGTILTFNWALPMVGLEEARTIAFSLLVVFQWFNAFNARSDRQSIIKLGLFSNSSLLWAVGLAVLLQVMVTYVPLLQRIFYTVPLSMTDWVIVILVSGSVLAVEEIRKLVAPRLFNRGK